MASSAQDHVNGMHEALNAHDLEALAKFYSEDCEIVAPPGEMRGRDALRQLSQTYWNAFSDLRWAIKHQCASEDTVVTEQIAEGTNDGPLVTPQGEVPPTGKRVATRICEVSRVRDGEIVSVHLYWDNLGFMQALGAMPGSA
jgi:steroid delta-isomerase-like uncharacterized protein